MVGDTRTDLCAGRAAGVAIGASSRCELSTDVYELRAASSPQRASRADSWR